MERRQFVKMIGAGGAVMMIPASYAACSEDDLKALQPWNLPSALPESDDVRLKIISYAILAPSAHNKQPWIVDVSGDGIDLYIDPSRLLPKTDPPARQITISQGTFLETLSIAATHFHRNADITLFPAGEDPVDQIGTHPVAHVTLTEDPLIAEDQLFQHLLARHTNRRAYTGPTLTGAEIEALHSSYADSECPLHFYTGSGDIDTVAGMMTESMRIETYDRAMHGETVSMLRFNDDEVEQYRDGLSFPNLGLSGFTLFLAKLFSSRNSAFDDSFLQRTVESIKESAYSARAIGLITSTGKTRTDEIMTGRNFMRLFLTATQLGLTLQPMSQVMEIESVKSKFLEFTSLRDEEPQMLFRLGRAESTPHSARRALDDFFKS